MPNPAMQISGTRVSRRTQNLSHPFSPFKRLLQLLVLCLAGLTMLGASDPSTRFDRLGHQLMCTCGCGEILLECNHVGCPVSGPMITELHNQLATTLPNKGVLDWFSDKYGPIVLAAPVRGGFDNVAWIMPFAVLALGFAAVFYFARLWKERHAATVLPQPGATRGFPDVHNSEMRDRIRRDTTFES